MATEDFIPVAADDWYQRRRNDQEGVFFRTIAAQAGISLDSEDTRQSIYCFTADGELLGKTWSGVPQMMERALAKWKELPAERRLPGAVEIDPLGDVDRAFVPFLPEDGLVLNVYTRILDREEDCWVKGDCSIPGGDKAARDHVWLSAEETRSLIPDQPQEGQAFVVPEPIASRILRFHLVDNTRGEPPFWEPDEVHRGWMTLTVESVTAETIEMRLDGAALLSLDPDPELSERGYDVQLHGQLRFQRESGVFDRFDVAAVGDHWGEGRWNRQGVREGRQPLGIAMTLGDLTLPADCVPPQGARYREAYFENARKTPQPEGAPS